MVSKKEQIAELEAKLKVAQAKAEHQSWLHECAKRDIEIRKARESARMRAEHAERQRKLKAAEREKRAEHLKELGKGIVRIGDAVESAIVHGEDGTHLELTFRLDGDEALIVGDNLRYRRPRIPEHVTEHEGQRITASYTDEWSERMQDSINKMRACAHRARDAYSF